MGDRGVELKDRNRKWKGGADTLVLTPPPPFIKPPTRYSTNLESTDLRGTRTNKDGNVL